MGHVDGFVAGTLQVSSAQHDEAGLHKGHVGGGAWIRPAARPCEHVVPELRTCLQISGRGADLCCGFEPVQFGVGVALCGGFSLIVGRYSQARTQQYEAGGDNHPVGAALDGDLAQPAVELGEELPDQAEDGQPAQVDALAPGEVEQQLHGPVVAVQVQQRRGRRAQRGVPVVPERVAGALPCPARPCPDSPGPGGLVPRSGLRHRRSPA